MGSVPCVNKGRNSSVLKVIDQEAAGDEGALIQEKGGKEEISLH